MHKHQRVKFRFLTCFQHLVKYGEVYKTEPLVDTRRLRSYKISLYAPGDWSCPDYFNLFIFYPFFLSLSPLSLSFPVSFFSFFSNCGQGRIGVSCIHVNHPDNWIVDWTSDHELLASLQLPAIRFIVSDGATVPLLIRIWIHMAAAWSCERFFHTSCLSIVITTLAIKS